MRVKVLIVEDDIDLGHLLKQYLEFNNFEVTQAFNGAEAGELLKLAQFDILILDVMMPHEDQLKLTILCFSNIQLIKLWNCMSVYLPANVKKLNC